MEREVRAGLLGETLLTELHHEVVDQEEDPRPGQAREEDGEEEGRHDTPLAVAASLDLHQVGTLDPVLLLLLPAAGRARLLLYIAGNRNNATPLTATLSYFGLTTPFKATCSPVIISLRSGMWRL